MAKVEWKTKEELEKETKKLKKLTIEERFESLENTILMWMMGKVDEQFLLAQLEKGRITEEEKNTLIAAHKT